MYRIGGAVAEDYKIITFEPLLPHPLTEWLNAVGRFVQRLRQAAAESPMVTVREARVKQLLNGIPQHPQSCLTHVTSLKEFNPTLCCSEVQANGFVYNQIAFAGWSPKQRAQ